MREIDDKIIKTNEFAIVKFYFDKKLIEQLAIDVVSIKIHVINNFVVNLLLDNDVLYF